MSHFFPPNTIMVRSKGADREKVPVNWSLPVWNPTRLVNAAHPVASLF